MHNSRVNTMLPKCKTKKKNDNSQNRIEKSVEWCITHLKQIDEDVDKDVLILEEQNKMLKNLRYEKDFWKELELKSVIGDEIIALDEFCRDVDEQMKHARNEFNNATREIRNLIDRESFADIIVIMRHLAQEPM